MLKTELNQPAEKIIPTQEREVSPVEQKFLNQETVIKEILVELKDSDQLTGLLRGSYEKKLRAAGIDSVWPKDVSIPDLRLALQRILLDIHDQRKIYAQDMAFFEKKTRVIGPLDKETADIIRQSSGEYRTNLLAAENLEKSTSPKVAEFIGQMIELKDALLDPNQKLAEINAKIAKCTLQFGSSAFSIKHCVGEQKYKHMMREFSRPGLSAKEFTRLRKEFALVLFGGRSTATLMFFELTEKGVIPKSKKLEQQLEQFLDNTFLETFDQFRVISRDLEVLISAISPDTTKYTPEVKGTIAYYLKEQVAQGKIDSAFAREIFLDLQHNGMDTLTERFVASFCDSISLPSLPKGRQEKAKLNPLIRRLIIAATVLTISSAAVGGSEKASQGIKGLLDNSASILRKAGERIGVHLPEPSPPADEKPKPLDMQTTADLLSISTEGQLLGAKGKVEDSDMELTHPESIGLGGDFAPTSSSLEHHSDTAQSIVWTLQNWQTHPQFMTTGIYTDIDQATGKYKRIVPSPADQGTVLNGISYESKSSQQNLLIGDRDDLVNTWVEAAFPENMHPSGGIVWAILNGKKVGEYQIEYKKISQTNDQFIRIKAQQKDLDWIKDRRDAKEELVLEIALTFSENTAGNEAVQFPPHKQKEIIPFSSLPASLQSKITELNASTLSDEEKMDEFVKWFKRFGIYSFNPIDDQNQYVNSAIKNGKIKPEDKVKAFYETFFNGSKYAPLGLTGKDQPRPGAGECERRNTSAWVAAQYLDLSDDWRIELQGGFRMDTLQPEIQGSQSHIRLVAQHKDGRLKILDVTDPVDANGVPLMDKATGEVLQMDSEILRNAKKNAEANAAKDTAENTAENNTTKNADGSPPKKEKPLHYEAKPEVSRYPTVLPDFVLDFHSIEPDFFTDDAGRSNNISWDTLKFNDQGPQFPWKFTQLEVNRTDPQDEKTGTNGIYYLSFLEMNDKGQFSISPNITSDVDDLITKNISKDSEVSHVDSKIVLNNTNIIPLLQEQFIPVNYPNIVERTDISSIRVKMDDYDVPYRLVNMSQLQPQLGVVIDLPWYVLKNREITISYRYGGITELQDKEKIEPFDFKKAQKKLQEMGFSDQEITRQYIEDIIHQLTSDTMTQKNGKQETGKELETRLLSFLKERVSILEANMDLPKEVQDFLHYLIQISEASPDNKTSLSDALSTIDEAYPHLMTEWLSIRNIHPIDWASMLGSKGLEEVGIDTGAGRPLIEGLQKRADEGKDTSLSLIFLDRHVEKLSAIDAFKSNRRAIVTFLKHYIDDYLLTHHFPISPESNHLKTRGTITAELATLQSCSDLHDSKEGLLACLTGAPYIDRLSSAILQNQISMLLNSGRLIKPPLSVSVLPMSDLGTGPQFQLSTDISGAGASGEFSSSNFHGSYYDQESKEYMPEQSVAYLSPPRSFLSPSVITPEKQLEALHNEQERTQAWFSQEVVTALTHGDPKALALFLTLLAPMSALAFAGTRALAHRRRWSLSRDIVEKTLHGEKSRGANKIKEKIASELGIDALDFSTAQLDKVWENTGEGFTPEQLFIRRWITQMGLEGKARAPFQIGHGQEVPENPWKSREVPPTYNTHMVLGKVNSPALAEMLGPEKYPETKIILETILEEGVSQLEKGETSFQTNEIVLTDLSAWKTQMESKLKQRLTLISVQPAAEDLKMATEEMAKIWQVIMLDWQTMHDKK
jgi:hypothetical protein